MTLLTMDYGRLVRKSPSLHGQKSSPTPKFLGTAEAYFVCYIGPNFQISLNYAYIAMHWVSVVRGTTQIGSTMYVFMLVKNSLEIIVFF